MRKILAALALMLLLVPGSACAATRALLVACSDFVTQPDLGHTVSGNLHMIGSVLLGAQDQLKGLSIEDGSIASPEALESAVEGAFSGANENDLSLLYICTHGVISSDDSRFYLLLSDGKSEAPLDVQQLHDILAPISGDKLLIVDACHSGALITGGEDGSPFFSDSSIHLLTSASAEESSWYYDSKGLPDGAVSYFAGALSGGLGLYGSPEADLNGDGAVTLSELHRYLNVSVPSSSCQMRSARADDVSLPFAPGISLSRPLSGFTFGASLLTADDPTLDFSFTVNAETAVMYRLVEYEGDGWNWAEAQTFMDGGDNTLLSGGRHSRCLTLPTVSETDSGYLMLQVFSVTGDSLILCTERLIAVQPVMDEPAMAIDCADQFIRGKKREFPISAVLGEPAEISVTVLDADENAVVRLCASRLTRPSSGGSVTLLWDGCGADGLPVEDGVYTIIAETTVGFRRIRASKTITVTSDD